MTKTKDNITNFAPRKRVTIYSASSPSVDACYFKAAEALAAALAQRGMSCIYGAGSQGLMGCVADSFLKNNASVTGIIPRFMVDEGWCHPSLTEVIVTETMHERKAMMAQMSDATIALPGGCGTLEELLEIITWKQLGLYTHPIIIYNTAGYYDALIELLQHAIEQRFMRDIHASLWHVATTPQEVLDALDTLPEWDPSLRKLALVK